MRTNWFRKPRGFKNAARNSARKGAVPPTSWDDIPNSNMPEGYDYAKRLFPQVHTFTEFEAKFRQKYPRWSTEEIRRVFNYAKGAA